MNFEMRRLLSKQKRDEQWWYFIFPERKVYVKIYGTKSWTAKEMNRRMTGWRCQLPELEFRAMHLDLTEHHDCFYCEHCTKIHDKELNYCKLLEEWFEMFEPSPDKCPLKRRCEDG